MSDLQRPGLPKPDPVLLRLQLIGRMQATTLNNDSVLPLGRKTRGLLAILALSGRRPVLRSKLAELLWSRRSEEQARASLRQEIHRLLEALAPLGAEVITVERHTLALKPALTSVDAERILNAGRNQAETLPTLDGVLLEELNGTDPALDVWLDTERLRLREHAVGLFEAMLRRQRDVQGQLTAARQLLLLDGLHEGAWRAQIQGHIALGEHGTALQSAERCLAAFAARNGAEPGPDTRRLLAELHATKSGGPDNGHAASRKAAPMPALDMVEQTVQPAGAAPHPVVPARPLPAHGLKTGPGFGAVPRPEDAQNGNAAADNRDRLRAERLGLPTIAVLPMLDLDGSLSDVVAKGLVEDLGVGLVNYTRMRLLHGSELQACLAQGRDDAVLRRGFGVDYVIDGSLQRIGGRIRVILRLADIRQHGEIVWAQRFDIPDGDLLALQDAITTRVVAQLPWEIMLVESRRLRYRPVSELDPLGLALQSLGHILRLDRISSDKACDLLREALQRDADHPIIHAFSALAHLLRGLQHWDADAGNDQASLAQQAVREALAREPTGNLGLSFQSLIFSEMQDEPAAALAVSERALALYPSTASAWAAATFPLLRLGRLDEAAHHNAHYKMLFRTHPLEALLDQPAIMIPLLQGEFGEAARTGCQLSELQPGFSPSLGPTLSALGHLRRMADAGRIRDRLRALRPAAGAALLVHEAGLRRAEDRDRYAEGLRLAGLAEIASAEPPDRSDAPMPALSGPASSGTVLGAARRAG